MSMKVPSVCPIPRCRNIRPCAQHPASGTSRGWDWPRLRTTILERDRFTCVLCGRPCGHTNHTYSRGIVRCDKLDVDHQDGNRGNDAAGNLRAVCRGWNRGSGRCK